MAEESYYCQSCGGVMEFDVKSQALKCPNCDNIVEIDGNREDVIEHNLNYGAIRKYTVTEKTTVTMTCSGCGAPIEVDKNSTALACTYCGSNYVMAKQQMETIIPDGVVTFKITMDQVRDIFRNWIKKRYLAPGELKNLYQDGKFKGMYVPYWTFDADAVAHYRAMGGRHRTVHYRDRDGRMHTRVVTDWFPTHGVVRMFFDDVLVCASQRNDNFLLDGIDKYNTKVMPSYSPDYMSGYSAQGYTIDLESGHGRALKKMSDELRNLASRDVLRRFDTVRDVRIEARFDHETYKYVYVPVYATNYSYKGKNYNVLINGENGNIKGEYPKSIIKIIAIIVAVVAIIIGIMMLLEGGVSYGHRYPYGDIEKEQSVCYNIQNDYYVVQDDTFADVKED